MVVVLIVYAGEWPVWENVDGILLSLDCSLGSERFMAKEHFSIN